MKAPLKIKLCDPTSFGCMTLFFEPTQARDTIIHAASARIERDTGRAPAPHEREAIGRKYDEAMKEAA